MKSVKKILLAALVLAASVAVLGSCSKEEVPQSYLDVTASNLAGSWKLVSIDGADLAMDSFFEISFVRKDKTFTINTNMDTFAPGDHYRTGRFSILEDQRYGSILKGEYDHGQGSWANSYIVRHLTKDSMEWVTMGEPSHIQVFERKVTHEAD